MGSVWLLKSEVVVVLREQHVSTRIQKVQLMLTVILALMSRMILSYATMMRPLQMSSMPQSCAVHVEVERIHASTRITARPTIGGMIVRFCTTSNQHIVETKIQLPSQRILCVVGVAVEAPTEEEVTEILYEYFFCMMCDLTKQKEICMCVCLFVIVCV